MITGLVTWLWLSVGLALLLGACIHFGAGRRQP